MFLVAKGSPLDERAGKGALYVLEILVNAVTFLGSPVSLRGLIVELFFPHDSFHVCDCVSDVVWVYFLDGLRADFGSYLKKKIKRVERRKD